MFLIASIDELTPEGRRHVAALVESLRNKALQEQPEGQRLAGQRFRGILVNYDTRPIAVMADPRLFLEGITPLWEEPIDLPRMQSAGRYVLDPERAALFEWFGSCTVIDWYELARMPPVEASAAYMGIHIPYTTITVNYAGDGQWALPAMYVTLKFDRLPVYLPCLGIDDGTLLLLGHEGRGVGCYVETKHLGVPKFFEDLGWLNERRARK